MVGPVRIRDADDGDVPAISDLNNALIATTTVAWTEEPETLEHRRAWFATQQARGHPVMVVEVEGTVVGFASYDDFRDSKKWPGYRFTVEHSIHVAVSHAGRGIGRALLEALVARAAASGAHTMIAAIDAENTGSITFHEHLGFTEVGRLPQTGFKFGRWLDLVLLQRTLSHTAAPPSARPV
jgi:phosphinothricin acetyltransferase